MARIYGIPVRLPASLLERTSEEICVVIPENYRDMLLSLVGDSTYWAATWDRPLTHDEILLLNSGVYGLQNPIGDCVTIQEEIDDLIRRIEELENVNICVSCCSCGSGTSCENVGSTAPPDGTSIVDPANDADVQPIDPNYDVYKCEWSHWAVAMFMDYINQLNGLVEAAQTEYEDALTIWENTMLPLVPGASYAWTIFYNTMIWAVAHLTGSVASSLLQLVNTNQDSLVCALYGAINQQDALERVSDTIMSWSASWFFRYGLTILAPNIPYDGLFLEEAQRPVIPATYQGLQCPCSEGGDNLPAGCTGTGGESYPAVTDFCYRQVDSTTPITTINDQGQLYEILGRDMRIYGSNHPGNVLFGFGVDLDFRPTNAIGLVVTVTKVVPGSSSAAARIGTDGSLTNPLFTGGTYVTQDVAESTYAFYVPTGTDARTQAIADAVTALEFNGGSATLQAEGVGGSEAFFGIEAAGGLAGSSYDFTIKKIAWMIYQGV